MKPSFWPICGATFLLATTNNLPICQALELPSSSVKIGNLFYDSPAGIAFIKNDESAFLLNIAGGKDFIPSAAAPDDSFHEGAFKDSPLKFTWSRQGDCVIARLTTTVPIQVPLQFSESSWPSFKSTYVPTSDGVEATAILSTGEKVDWKLRVSAPLVAVDSKKAVVPISPESPVYFVAGFGQLPEFGQIEAKLKNAAARYAKQRPTAQGDWGNFVGAIADNLNNTRLYSNDNKMVAHTVTRNWVVKGYPNSFPFFCWDSFFNGLLASLDDPKTARDTIRATLANTTEEGFVPNFSHWRPNNPFSDKRSQPPVGAMCVWKMHQFQPDVNFLKEVFPKLEKWHSWWLTARDGNKNGLLEWGGDIPMYECGWDDTPHFNGYRRIGNTMNVDAIDLNSLYTADAQYLAKIADEIGLPAKAAAYRAESTLMTERINNRLWNEDLQSYCSRFWGENNQEGTFLTRLTPMNFYPLIAGIPNKERGQKVISLMTDPKKFWGTWILPTVAYDDPEYPKQAYWKGKVWAPTNYLVFQGLKQYGSPRQIIEFAHKSVDLFMRNWEKDSVCGENYLSTTGEQKSERSDPHYTWGALLCLIGLESTVSIEDNGRIQAHKGFEQNIQLSNVPLLGKKYRISVRDGQTKISPQ